MKPLKLIALEDEDLAIVSAHVQDGLSKPSDLKYLPAEKRFVIAMNRFAWETGKPAFRHKYQRRRSVLHFERVLRVESSGIDRSNKDDVLSLLAVEFVPSDPPAGVIALIFAGGAAIRLTVECIEARLSDLGPAWETGSRPVHDP
jgi:hypothetical protein